MEGWKRGVRLAVDVGSVRIGIARCDPDGILATPVTTVRRDPRPSTEETVPRDVLDIAALVAEYEAVEVVVGLPLRLNGTEGLAAVAVREYAVRLAAQLAPLPVLLSDERMSTVVAGRRLSERGVKGKAHRAVVDQAAAVEILQSWLEAQRRR